MAAGAAVGRPEPDDRKDEGARGSSLETARLVFASGAGLLADGYDLTVINMAFAILARLYPSEITASSKSLVASLTLLGVLLGQLVFGALADVVGRKSASVTTATLTVVGALASACVTGEQAGASGMTGQLVLCRFILGLGIGGEYPLSAVISKEVGSGRLCLTRAQLLVCNMSMFNLGQALQCMLVLALVKSGIELDAVWRVAVGFGAVPSAVALALRLQMEEPQITDLDGLVSRRGDGDSWRHHFGEIIRSRGSILLGACLSWLIFNFVAYGQGTFNAIIAEVMLGTASSSDLRSTIMQDADFALLCGFFSIYGSFVSLLLEPRMPRSTLQTLGFAIVCVANWLDGGLLISSMGGTLLLVPIYFLARSGLSILSITTYLVPAEHFPASSRGTCMGLAAASGKLGAVIGTGLFPVVEEQLGLGVVMLFCSFVLLVGCGVTRLLTPECAHSRDAWLPVRSSSFQGEKRVQQLCFWKVPIKRVVDAPCEFET